MLCHHQPSGDTVVVHVTDPECRPRKLETVILGFRNHPSVQFYCWIVDSVVKVSSLQTPDVYLVVMSHYGNKILCSISTLTPQRCGKLVPAAPLLEGGGE